MIAPPERSAERDEAIAAMLPHVPFEGWTRRALRSALVASGQSPEDGELLFPGGIGDMIEAYFDLADRLMAEAAAALDLPAMRVPARVRALIALRLRQMAPHRDAVRRALALLALPRYAAVSARCLARTVDAIWHAAGDRSADFNWYTKRATLAGVYGTTLLFWLRQPPDDEAATLAFLDRRLAGVARFGRLRGQAGGVLTRCRPRRQAA